jgi:hypothetical protein
VAITGLKGRITVVEGALSVVLRFYAHWSCYTNFVEVSTDKFPQRDLNHMASVCAVSKADKLRSGLNILNS